MTLPGGSLTWGRMQFCKSISQKPSHKYENIEGGSFFHDCSFDTDMDHSWQKFFKSEFLLKHVILNRTGKAIDFYQ